MRVYSSNLAALTVPSLTKATPETEPVGGGAGEGLVGAPPHELARRAITMTTAGKTALPAALPCISRLQRFSTEIRGL